MLSAADSILIDFIKARTPAPLPANEMLGTTAIPMMQIGMASHLLLD